MQGQPDVLKTPWGKARERLAGKETEAAAQAVRFCFDRKIPLLPVYYISPSGSTEPAGSFYRAASAAQEYAEKYFAFEAIAP